MKSALLFVFALCAVAYAYPRNSREEPTEDNPDDTELVIVPLQGDQLPNFGIELSEDLTPPAFQHPFFRTRPWAQAGDRDVNDLMSQVQDMLKEMRKQLTDLVQHHHIHHPEDSDVGTRIGDDDLPKNKSTSTTKVIDGNVVTVNETVFTSGDDNVGAVFRIKVVEVKPTESPEGETESVDEGSPETEDKSGAEEPKFPEPTTSKSELEEDKHEETNEIPNQKVRYEWGADIDPSLNEIYEPVEFSVEQFNPPKENYYDLSSDINVNHYMSEHADSQGLIMIDPDAELVDPVNSYYHYDREPQRLQTLSH